MVVTWKLQELKQIDADIEMDMHKRIYIRRVYKMEEVKFS